MAISTEDSLEQPQKHARFDVRMQAICHDVSNSSSSRAGLDRYVFGSAHNWQLEQTQTSCPVSSVAYVPLRVLAKRRKRGRDSRKREPKARQPGRNGIASLAVGVVVGSSCRTQTGDHFIFGEDAAPEGSCAKSN
ncbi:hypothetical protein FDECE_4278 [Fusarium decemcellulare]|nr:hypothetical protein FDECE_4278 [Fusarium decemcellulare]